MLLGECLETNDVGSRVSGGLAKSPCGGCGGALHGMAPAIEALHCPIV